MEINGLPLHPLVVHAAVVFGPLAALAAIVYAVVPAWRDRLRWPVLALAVVAVVSIWVAVLSGEDLLDARFATATGELAEKLQTHEDRAVALRLWVTGFGVVAVLATWLHSRAGAVRVVLSALLAVSAVGVLVWSVLTGDAGSQAVWGS